MGFTYTYNLAGSLTSEAYPSGRTVTTNYDGANRVTDVTGNFNAQQTPYVSGAVYAPQGVPSFYGYANQVTRTVSYNSRLQWNCAQDVWQNSPSSYLWMTCPNWGAGNDNGNLQGVTTYAGGPAVLSSLPVFTTTFAYDNVNRLTSANDTGWSRSYGYDPYGNMWVTGASGVTPPGNMPTSNVYASNRINGASYDGVGNQTVVSGGTLAYDAENHIVSAYDPVTHNTEDYLYDGNGRRVEKSIVGGVSTTYVYDAFGNLAAEYGAMQGNPPCTTCYLSYDWLGTLRMVTDANGNVVARHDFLPFGQEIPANTAGRNGPWGSTSDVEQKFTGKIRDQGTGMDFFGARYYGNALGRFTSPDPLRWLGWQRGNSDDQRKFASWISNPQNLNLYAYVDENPLSRTDPTGLYTCQGTKEQCATVKAAVESIAKAAASSKLTADQRKALGTVSKFLGTDRDKNGVFIALGDPHGNQGETVTKGGVTTLTITFSGMSGNSLTDAAERGGLIAHEGTHGIDQRTNGMPMSRQQELTTETHAYNSQSLVFKGLGASDYGYGLWTPGWTDAQRQNAVNSNAVSDTNHWCAEWAAAGGGVSDDEVLP